MFVLIDVAEIVFRRSQREIPSFQLRNNLQQSPSPNANPKNAQAEHSKSGAAQCTGNDSTSSSNDHQPDDSLTDDVIDMSADIDNPPSSPDDDLERYDGETSMKAT